MKNILLPIAFLFLSGCAVKPVIPEQPIVKETVYVIKIPPTELMTLPPGVPSINVDTAKQSDVAAWLIIQDSYTRALEDKLKDIAKFFVTEKKKLDENNPR